MNTRNILACPLLLVLSIAAPACGGDKQGAKSPESNSGITETSAKEDMPPPPAKEGEAPKAVPDGNAAPGSPAGGMIKIAAMKLSPSKAGKHDKAIELKADGTIVIDGKPAAKVKGDQVDSIQGTSMVTIGLDGTLVGNGVNPGFKFDGDDLTSDSGLKLSVGDDGTITATKDGKSEAIVKAEGGASAKRAALIVAVLWMSAADPPKVEKKPAGKTPKPAKKK